MAKDVPGRNGGTLRLLEKGETANPEGRPIGSKNRSTIARKVLEMAANFPDKTFEVLQKKYPDIEKSMTIEEMMSVVQAHKAIVKKDTFAYERLLDSAYGKSKGGDDQTGIKVPSGSQIIINLTDKDDESDPM